jgi:hypothetical protein
MMSRLAYRASAILATRLKLQVFPAWEEAEASAALHRTPVFSSSRMHTADVFRRRMALHCSPARRLRERRVGGAKLGPGGYSYCGAIQARRKGAVRRLVPAQQRTPERPPMITDMQSSLTFQEFFMRAQAKGYDDVEVAEALLRNIKSDAAAGKVIGVRRIKQWVSPSMAEDRERHALRQRRDALARQIDEGSHLRADERREMMAVLNGLDEQINSVFEGWREDPRDPLPRPVPVSIWQMLETVRSDCTSAWAEDDDDEIPMEWAEADFMFGTVSMQFGDLTEYSALRIDIGLAELILDDLSYSPVAGLTNVQPFSDEERRAWIAQRTRTPGGADHAHAEYKKHPRFDGTGQLPFRAECREIWGPQNGRPKKS